jgi:hypothetical protein
VVAGSRAWRRVDNGLGQKAGAGLRVVASVMVANGEEQGLEPSGRQEGVWGLELDGAGKVGG